MEHTTDVPQEDTPQITITECDDKAPELDDVAWNAPTKTPAISTFQKLKVAKDMINGHSEHLNTHTKQIKELQIAIFTLNKVLHIFRDKGLNSLEETLLNLIKTVATNYQNNLDTSCLLDGKAGHLFELLSKERLRIDVMQDEWNLTKAAIEEGIEPAAMKRLERLEAALLESSDEPDNVIDSVPMEGWSRESYLRDKENDFH